MENRLVLVILLQDISQMCYHI